MFSKLTHCLLCILLLFSCFNLRAQQKTIAGKIINTETRLPLQGVNINLKGTATTIISDAEGSFSIPVPGNNSVLVFSYVGYGTQEITVGAQSSVSISMSTVQKSMDEVVVIGYGTVKRRDLTGAVSSIKAADIVRTPTANAVEAMQGRVAGVDITRSSGVAGSGVNIRVRGNRSINGNNNPLYIIDGFQGGSPGDLNTNDIESMEVLKDASATAIYGSQGANGVIIITTKKGVAGRTRVSYDAYYGVNGYTSFPKAKIRDSYIQLRREAYRTTGEWASAADDARIFPNAAEYAAVQAGQWIDWFDIINRNGTQQSHTVSVRGGSERTKIFVSLGYFGEQGMLRRNDFSRYNVRFNLDQTINKWAKAGLQNQISYFDQNNRQDPLSVVLSTSPLGVPYDSLGNINIYPVAGSSILSPITDERGDTVAKNNSIRASILTNAFIELTPFKGLSFRSNFGVNLNFSRQGIFNSATSLAQRTTRTTTASQADAFSRAFNLDNILTYNNQLGDHSFTITAIQSYLQSDVDNLSGSGINQLLGSQLYYNLGATAPTTRSLSSGYIGSNLLSFAGRINYNYKGKYLLTLTERADGASRLSPGNKWDYFPSAAVGWNVSDEKFMNDVSFLSNVKLRGSYGVTGNYGIDVYGTQSGISASQNIGFGDVQLTQYQFNARIGNAELEWEKSATANIGLDFSLLRNRLSGSVDIYKTITSNIILDRRLPLSTGLGTTGSVYQNVGKTENRGIEVSLTSDNIRGTRFRWSTTVTFTKNKEKITELINGTDIISTTDPERMSLLLGRPVSNAASNSFFYYRKQGIWQTEEAAKASALRIGTYRFQPGDIKLEDINGDSLIDTRDRTYLGSTVPKFVLGLQNNFSYKGFDVGIFLLVRYGQMINGEFLGRYNPSGEGSGPEDFSYWTPENPTNDFPRPRKLATLSGYQGYTGYLALNYTDGSFFKIKTVNLGYTLPRKLSMKISSESIRFYATGNNIFTKAKSHLLKNYDPERGGAESSPLSRQVVFGVNVGF